MKEPDAVRSNKFELEVEGVRGLAALMVLYTHVLAPNHDVDPRYVPWSHWYDFEAGQGAVLLFFVLSGYVIGLTNQKSFSAAACGQYLLRRFVRLVPLCWLAIALSVLVVPRDSWHTIVANVLFLQNDLPYGSLHLPLLSANTNLWSLNYEILYYLLFILLWAWPRHTVLALVTAGSLVALGLVIPGFPPILTNYAAGWMFWLCGCWLASTPRAASDDLRWPWPSLLLFALATWKVKPLYFVAHRFALNPPMGEGWVNFTFLDFLPACVVLVMIAALRRPRIGRVLAYVSAMIPVSFLAWRMLRGRFLGDELAVYDGLVLAGIGLWWLRPSLRFFRIVAPVGAISYGLYIFQRPAQWAVAYSDLLPSGSVLTFALRAIVITGLTVGLAWLAEKKLQPVIRRICLGRH
ncbi:MAG TPA: acyltransferase [Candidatus Limnocylindria bacterium]|jgi:peptidoglycan/LPS O-acetylase OafA/YrhL|nr:acyltransferase [Candidatus Limnocylindria bacterium]HTL66468.1 acyltransferase [Lacunisphaera sp.]